MALHHNGSSRRTKTSIPCPHPNISNFEFLHVLNTDSFDKKSHGSEYLPNNHTDDFSRRSETESNRSESILFAEESASSVNAELVRSEASTNQSSGNGRNAVALPLDRRREDANAHIFTAALLEHLCTLFEPRQDRRKAIFQILGAQLSEKNMMPLTAFHDTFAFIRRKYFVGFTEMVNALITDQNFSSPKALQLLTDDDTLSKLSLVVKPKVPKLLRETSDPRHDLYSSRYSQDFYEISTIGKGGFGSVFKVRNKLDDVLYAVKKVKLKQLSYDKCHKVLREVKLLASLNHSSIVRYNSAWFEQSTDTTDQQIADFTEATNSSSSGTDGAVCHPPADVFDGVKVTLYIQMELCTGSLYDWLIQRNKKITDKYSSGDVFTHLCEAEISNFIKQILSGLDYIHNKKIIHRDIKTRNIFIGAHDTLRIGDFGLARDIIETPSPTAVVVSSWKFPASSSSSDPLSRKIGTSFYASPEQRKGQLYDQKTDIYSAGIVIYELYHPFCTEMEKHKCIETLVSEGQLPAQLLEKYPAQIEMVKRMILTDSSGRPSAKELLNSDIYFQPNQIISHLESRIEELECRNARLQRENQLLHQFIQIESHDYANFLEWKKRHKIT